MSKFGRRFLRRLATPNSKMNNRLFYKGRGSRNEGTHTNKGGYVLRPERLLVIIAPDLTGCELQPYVHNAVPKPPKGARIPNFVGRDGEPQLK